MRVLILLVSFGLVSACAAPHAVKVHCDRHLVPINAWAAPKASQSSVTGQSAPRSVVQ